MLRPRPVRPLLLFVATTALACSGGSSSSGPGDAGPTGADGAADSSVVDTGSAAHDSGASDADGASSVEACGADIQNDPRNCGACGLDCVTAACRGGFCTQMPVALVRGATPDRIAVDGSSIYWVDLTAGYDLEYCAITGCVGQPTLLWSGGQRITGLAVQRGTIVFPMTSVLATCSIAGCTGTFATLASVSGEPIFGFGVDTMVAYYSATDIFSCAISGCAGMPSVLDAYPDSGTNGAGPIAVGGGNLAWIDETGTLKTCPTASCEAATRVVGMASARTTVMSVDSTRVYWIDPGQPPPGTGPGPYTGGAVYSCPLAGCPGAPTVLGSYPSWLPGAAMAVDGTDVYWSTSQPDGSYGEIVRCALAGCGGTPTPLATTAQNAGGATDGLALDAANVYWSDSRLGQILAVPK